MCFQIKAMWTLADFSADGAMYCKEFAEVMTRILVAVCEGLSHRFHCVLCVFDSSIKASWGPILACVGTIHLQRWRRMRERSCSMHLACIF